MLQKTKVLIATVRRHLPAIAVGLTVAAELLDALTAPKTKRIRKAARRKQLQ